MRTPHAKSLKINHASTLGFLILYNPQSLHHLPHFPPISLPTSSKDQKKMAHLPLFLLLAIYILSSSLAFSSPVQDPDLVVQEVHR